MTAPTRFSAPCIHREVVGNHVEPVQHKNEGAAECRQHGVTLNGGPIVRAGDTVNCEAPHHRRPQRGTSWAGPAPRGRLRMSSPGQYGVTINGKAVMTMDGEVGSCCEFRPLRRARECVAGRANTSLTINGTPTFVGKWR